ncbi:MAG: cytidylate kinase-like family protein [Dorea sp.]
MEENQKKCHEIAERIYDLDVKVYESVGSALGRTFTDDRQTCVENLTGLMTLRPQGHLLRSELALISNMARTIKDEEVKAEVMTEYDAILKAVAELPDGFGKVDILNKKRAKLNTARTKKKFKKGDHLVICIGRTQGSAGNDIGFALADALHINYYDIEILQEVLKRLDVTNDAKVSGDKDQDGLIEDKYQKNFGEAKGLKQKLHDFNRYHGLNKDDAIFFNQSDLLCKMAKEEDFVVMGRCADVILANNHIPHISIFITAPFEQRVKRYMEINNLSLKQAVHELKKMDKKHRKYFQFYSGVKWGDAENYDICFNSASYGIEDSVEIIERMLNKIPGVSWNKKEA